MTRDYDDPDDLPGLASDAILDRLDGAPRIPPPIMGPPRRDRWNLPTPDVLGQHISLDIATRLLAGESFLIADATPADLLAGRLVEIPFPNPQPQEPTMHADHRPMPAAAAADAYRPDTPDMIPDDPHSAGHVTIGLRRLASEVDGLERLTEALFDRLGDALREDAPIATDTAGPPPGEASSLAHRLHGTADRLDGINGRLARLLDRIDL